MAREELFSGEQKIKEEATKLPAPADYGLSVGDVALVIDGKKGWTAQVSALIGRFYIDEETARAWVKLVKELA